MTSAYKTGQHCTRLTSKNLHLGYQDRFCSVPSVVRSWTSLKMEMTVCLANNATMKNQLIVGGHLALVLHLHGSFNVPWAAYDNIVITTRSHPDAFPSALRQKRKTQTKQHDKGDQGTLVVHPPVDTLPMLTTT